MNDWNVSQFSCSLCDIGLFTDIPLLVQCLMTLACILKETWKPIRLRQKSVQMRLLKSLQLLIFLQNHLGLKWTQKENCHLNQKTLLARNKKVPQEHAYLYSTFYSRANATMSSTQSLETDLKSAKSTKYTFWV